MSLLRWHNLGETVIRVARREDVVGRCGHSTARATDRGAFSADHQSAGRAPAIFVLGAATAARDAHPT